MEAFQLNFVDVLCVCKKQQQQRFYLPTYRKLITKGEWKAVAIWIKIFTSAHAAACSGVNGREKCLAIRRYLNRRSSSPKRTNERNTAVGGMLEVTQSTSSTCDVVAFWKHSLQRTAHKFKVRNSKEFKFDSTDNRSDWICQAKLTVISRHFMTKINQFELVRAQRQSESEKNDTIKNKLNELSVIYFSLLGREHSAKSEEIKHSWQITSDHQTMLTHRSAKTARFITDFHKLRSDRAHFCHCRKFVYKTLIT